MKTYSGPTVEILYEDDAVVVVNKPAGLIVHSDGRTPEPTLTDWVLEKYPHLEDVGGLHTLDNGKYAPRAGILHRLDRETSGVILIAKSDTAFWPLQQQFMSREIEKRYIAMCLGAPKEPKGIIDLPIGRSRVDYRQWATPPIARGTLRPALTEYILLYSGEYAGEMFSCVQLFPKTGRTHQLRVHAKAMGFPILCDARYEIGSALGFARVALHAERVVVKHPINGRVHTFVAPPPADFRKARELLSNVVSPI